MGLHMGNTGFLGDVAGGHFVVTRKHVDFDSLGLEGLDGLDRGVLEFVRKGQDGIDLYLVEEERHRMAGVHPGTDAVAHHGVRRLGQVAAHVPEQVHIAHIVAPAMDRTGDALAQDRLEILHREVFAAPEGLADSEGERMLGTVLQRIKDVAEVQGRGIVFRRDGRVPDGFHHGGLPFRQGAGLVHDHRLDFPGDLQALRILDEDALGSPVADAGDDGGRRSQAQRARAGDDKDRHHGQKTQGDFPAQDPDEERQDGDADDDGHEDRRDAVHRLLDRGLGALRVPYHPDDAGKEGVLPHFLHLHGQGAVLVDGAGIDMGTSLLEGRDRFAGQRALIHVGGAVRDQAVHRKAFARLHQDRLSRAGRRALLLQADQFADGSGGAVFRPLLQQPADEDEGDDHRRRFEVQMGLQPLRGPHLREQEVEYAEQIGNGHRQGHERVHVGTAMAQGAESGLEEPASAPEDDRGREGPQDESFSGEILKPHAEQHYEGGQHAGEERIFLQGAEGVLAGYLGFRVGFVVGTVHQHVVTGILDGFLQFTGRHHRRVIIDLGGIGGQ